MSASGDGILRSARGLRRQPLFAATTLVSLALGIGVAAALASLFEQVALRPLAVPRPEELVRVREVLSGRDSAGRGFGLSHDAWRSLRGEMPTALLAASGAVEVSLQSAATDARAGAELVSDGYFEVLGLRPALGRLFTAGDEHAAMGEPVVVLSHSLWHGLLGADPGVVGTAVRINGREMRVLGVLERAYRGWRFGEETALYLPLSLRAVASPGWQARHDASSAWLEIIGRVTAGPRRAGFESAAGSWHAAFRARGGTEPGVKFVIEMGGAEKRGAVVERVDGRRLSVEAAPRGSADSGRGLNRALLYLALLAGLVAVTLGLNTAQLLALRVHSREREFAVRAALGASQRAIVRAAAAEGLWLVAAGSILAVAVAALSSQLLIRWFVNIDPTILSADVGARLAAITGAVAALVAVVCVALLALELSGVRAPLLTGREIAHAAPSGHSRWRSGALAFQVALSVFVVLAAALLLRSFQRAVAIPDGLDEEDVVQFELAPAAAGWDAARARTAIAAIEERLREQSEVLAVGRADLPILGGQFSMTMVTVEGYEPAPEEVVLPTMAAVDPEFFAALRVPVVRGRGFRVADRADAPAVVLINESFARRYFEGRDPIGRRVSDWEVVGVVADARLYQLQLPATPSLFRPVEQAAEDTDVEVVAFTVRARNRAAAAALLKRVPSMVRTVAPGLPVGGLYLVAERRARALATERLAAEVAAVFAGLVSLLAVLGLQGVLGFTLARRRREIGIRIAVGAEPRRLVRWFLGQGMRPVAFGAALGLAAALPATRLLRGVLYEIEPFDLFSLITAPAVVLLLAALVTWTVARRAARVDPLETLRSE